MEYITRTRRWVYDSRDHMPINATFSFRGRKALLLGLSKGDKGNCLWVVYERRVRNMPPASSRSLRSLLHTFYRNDECFHLKHLAIQNKPVFPEYSATGTIHECGVKPGMAEFVLQRARQYGGFPRISPHDLMLVRRYFDDPLDFQALRDADAVSYSLGFGEHPYRHIVEQPFPLSTTTDGMLAFDLADAKGLSDLTALLRNVLKEDSVADYARKLRDICVWTDRNLVFIECADDHSMFYTKEFLDRYPLSMEWITTLNDVLVAWKNERQRRLCCIGFVRKDVEGSIPAELFADFITLPEEHVEVIVRKSETEM